MSEHEVQALLDQYARACADVLTAADAAVSIIRGAGATIVVAAFPPLPEHQALDLTECDRAVLTLLAGKNVTVPAQRIRDELETRGLYVCSLDTIKRSLKKLKALRLVVPSRKKPRGYHLPLFQAG